MKISLFAFVVFFSGISLKSFSQDKIDLLILNKNYAEALQTIEQRIDRNPKAGLFLKKGLIYSSLQNYQKAIGAFRAGLALEPANSGILEEIAEAYSTIGNYQDALPYFERAIHLQPENLPLMGKLGRNYINLKKFRKAFDVFSEIYSHDSTNVYWNKQLAFSAFQIGKKIQAIELYKKVIELNPRDYSSYFNLAKLYEMQEKPDSAMRIIQNGLTVFPGDDAFFYQEANYWFARKNYEEAKRSFEKYFVAGGDSTYKALLNYGISLYFSKNETKAISILEICAGQVANDPFALFYLSLSHKRLVHYEVAEAFMNAAIESATPYYLPEMYHHLGQIYGQERKFTESIEALKKANKLDPTNYEILFEIATTYEEYNSNKTLALNYYRIYLKEAGEEGRNLNYALDRITKIKEDLFFEE